MNSTQPASSADHRLSRAALPLLMGQLVFIAALCLAAVIAFFLRNRADLEGQTQLERSVRVFGHQIEQGIAERITLLDQAVSFWLFSEVVSQEEFEGYIARLFDHRQRFSDVAFAGADGVVRWSEPRSSLSALHGQALFLTPEYIPVHPQTSEPHDIAIQVGQVHALGGDGLLGLAMVAPIHKADQLSGILVGQLRVEDLLVSGIVPLREAGVSVRILERPSNRLIYEAGPVRDGTATILSELELELQGTHWQIRASAPRPSSRPSAAWTLVLGGGLLSATLLGGLTTLLSFRKRHLRASQRALEERAQQLEQLNTRLAEADTRNKQTISELEQSNNRLEHAREELLASHGRLELVNLELADANIQLRLLNRELDDFSYIVSHDLKEPLRGIQAFGQFLEEDYYDQLDELGRSYLTNVKHCAERMKALIDDLMQLARVTRSRSNLQVVDLNFELEQVLRTLSFTLQSRNAQVVVPEALPEVWSDPTQIRLVLTNLISNGIKYNQSETPRVELSWVGLEDEVELRVRDNGIGIEARYHEKIFGLFERLFTQEEFEGTGAGLAIVRRIVEQHGGRIWVESTPGEGSCFHFTARRSAGTPTEARVGTPTGPFRTGGGS